MSELPRPPKAFQAFVSRYPKAGEAWDLLRDAADEAGGLDKRTALLVKLGIAIGTARTGAVHSATRKATAAGIPRADLEQVIALAAPNIGLPSAVAAHCWVTEELDKERA